MTNFKNITQNSDCLAQMLCYTQYGACTSCGNKRDDRKCIQNRKEIKNWLDSEIKDGK